MPERLIQVEIREHGMKEVLAVKIPPSDEDAEDFTCEVGSTKSWLTFKLTKVPKDYTLYQLLQAVFHGMAELDTPPPSKQKPPENPA